MAIIGAGYTGLTAALTLAKAGKSVQVFDKEHPGEGASSRNGGITSGSLRIGLQDAIRRFGEARGVALHRETARARAYLLSLMGENEIDCDYDQAGLFTGALTTADFDAQKRSAAFVNATVGADLQTIEGQQLTEYTGSNSYVGGVFNPQVGTVHPAKLVSGLVDAAGRHGARVHGRTVVTAVSRTGPAFEIKTTRGTCRAGDVIVGTNGYTDASDPWLRRRLVPVTSRIIVTEELPQNLIASLMPGRCAMGEVKKVFSYYRLTPDKRRILLGSREPAWSTDRFAAIQQMRGGLTRIFPELSDTAITHSWSGNVAFSRTQLPLMFQNDGVHYAVGYCGSGTVWAPWLGYQTALKLLKDPSARSCFDASAPKSIPFYREKPWFLPFVISGYRMTDWLRGRS